MTALCRPRNGVLIVLAVATVATLGCRRSIDPVASLEPVDVVTGWFDAGIVEGGKNKLVPSVSLKLRNKTDDTLRSIHIGVPQGQSCASTQILPLTTSKSRVARFGAFHHTLERGVNPASSPQSRWHSPTPTSKCQP